ncbi:MAG: TrmH family RNA methyltransferase, partial [Hyphomicrobium sp.]|nr:TrmH family RNA methyltransferase [Hyphomicrobium sp.]
RDMPAPVEHGWPAFCLVRPQMGENIGAVARVMLNYGLVNMRVVEPRDRWPNPKAQMVASGADRVLDAARVDWKLDDALADATLVIASTARPRDMEKPVWSAREAAANVNAAINAGGRPVILFGAEATGLNSDEVARADAIVTLPVNPGFASLNLANAAAVIAFAIGEARAEGAAPSWFHESHAPPATQGEIDGLIGHFETELEYGRFYHPMEKAPLMRQNLRNIFKKARLTDQEVRTMRGVIKALVVGRGGRKLPGPAPKRDDADENET